MLSESIKRNPKLKIICGACGYRLQVHYATQQRMKADGAARVANNE